MIIDQITQYQSHSKRNPHSFSKTKQRSSPHASIHNTKQFIHLINNHMKPHITIIAHVQWGTLDPARFKLKDTRAASLPAHGVLTMRTQQSMLIRCNTNKSRDSDIVEILLQENCYVTGKTIWSGDMPIHAYTMQQEKQRFEQIIMQGCKKQVSDFPLLTSSSVHDCKGDFNCW